MQNYFCEHKITENFLLDKLSYIIKNTIIKSYNINDNSIDIAFLVNVVEKFTIKIFYEESKNNFKPLYIYVENENISEYFSENLCKELELINNNIHFFERVEDLIFTLNNSIKKINNITEEFSCTKNIKKFNQKLENLKKETGEIFNSKLLSNRACLEFISDQLLKLYNDERINIDLNNFANININISNFTFKNNANLIIKIVLKLSSDFITNPPNISLSSNKILKDNILQIIEKLKPFSNTNSTKNSWSIKYSIYDTIINIYEMINKYGEVASESNNYYEVTLTDLEYLLSIKNQNVSEIKLLELFDKDLTIISDYKTDSNTYWKKGTGYGNSSAPEWNIEEYIKNVNSKKNKITSSINLFLNSLFNNKNKNDFDKNHFNLFLKDESIPSRLLILFQSYINDDEINKNIVMLMADFLLKYKNIFYKSETDKEFINFNKTIASVKEYMTDNNIEHDIIKNYKNISSTIFVNTNLDDYQKMFNEYKFKFNDNSYSNFHYAGNNIALSSSQVPRLQKEFMIIKRSIVITKEASIFFNVVRSNINQMRFIITGPKNTPYHYGLLIFDMTMPADFPNKPPHVTFINNGGKRFNPNLYDTGKVCLSLLGTWSGSKGESWNSLSSTINQILISIQSQILVDEPFFNEPGYEKSIGKPDGIVNSKKYNINIQQFTVDHTMNDLLENFNKYPEFEFVIKNYFKYHKNNIIEVLNQWYSQSPTPKLKTSIDKFILLTNNL